MNIAELKKTFPAHVKTVWVKGNDYWFVPQNGAEKIELNEIEEESASVQAESAETTETKSKKIKK